MKVTISYCWKCLQLFLTTRVIGWFWLGDPSWLTLAGKLRNENLITVIMLITPRALIHLISLLSIIRNYTTPNTYKPNDCNSPYNVPMSRFGSTTRSLLCPIWSTSLVLPNQPNQSNNRITLITRRTLSGLKLLLQAHLLNDNPNAAKVQNFTTHNSPNKLDLSSARLAWIT